MEISALAGKPVEPKMLIDVPQLITAYYTGTPDSSESHHCVAFGTSGHRGSSLKNSFNEKHILAITQAICFFRKEQKIDGPLFLGFDTHALSVPAFATVLEVLAANNVEVMISEKDQYTPTPVISHAILKYNHDRKTGLADGIVLTPSHNPPDNGGLKYNPPHGGPAGTSITHWIETHANQLLKTHLHHVKRVSFDAAIHAMTTHRYDYLNTYVNDLGDCIDMELLCNSRIKMGVNPLGGAGIHYWEAIADLYCLDLTIVNKSVDPTFSFMTADWDGQIRMDPSSPYAMRPLIDMKDRFDISFACDTDHDRHGIVTKSAGLLNPNNYLSVAVYYLLQHRPQWLHHAAIGKTIVTSQLINRITSKLGRAVYDVPVGFKWFVDGLLDSTLCFGGEESAGASFSRQDGSVWTTDKDGFTSALLAAEITSKLGRDPGIVYHELTKEFGEPVYERIEAKATSEEKEKLKKLSATKIESEYLAGEKITRILTKAPGNHAPIEGLKIQTENGWFAARPSGTEDIYKIYAESFLGNNHLKELLHEAEDIVSAALAMEPNGITV
jgi:phosphoglucomutase